MFEVKEDPYYKKYYLFGKCVWKRQRSTKEVVAFLLSEMQNHCTDMQAIIRKNTRKILTYVDEHYEPKKVTRKKHK